MSWFDQKTSRASADLKLFTKISSAVGVSGITGLDRLTSFMIVTELQVSRTENHVFTMQFMTLPLRLAMFHKQSFDIQFISLKWLRFVPKHVIYLVEAIVWVSKAHTLN